MTRSVVQKPLPPQARPALLRPVEPQASSIDLTGLPRPLPLGEVALRSNDGEGKPGRKEPLRSDGQALCQSDTIAVPELFVSGLALSVSLRSPALPKGEPLPERASVNLWKMHDRKEKNL